MQRVPWTGDYVATAENWTACLGSISLRLTDREDNRNDRQRKIATVSLVRMPSAGWKPDQSAENDTYVARLEWEATSVTPIRLPVCAT